MRTFALVTVHLDPDKMGLAGTPDETEVDGVVVSSDETDDLDLPCEGGDHNVGFLYLSTCDASDVVITTCMPCTMREVKAGIIVRIAPRENREPVT